MVLYGMKIRANSLTRKGLLQENGERRPGAAIAYLVEHKVDVEAAWLENSRSCA